jgi:hypothetical protein
MASSTSHPLLLATAVAHSVLALGHTVCLSSLFLAQMIPYSLAFHHVPIFVYFRCDTATDQKQMKGLDQFKHVSMQSLPIGLRGAVQAGWYEGSVFFAIMGALSSHSSSSSSREAYGAKVL